MLILGPTGSGKEVVARMIHELSRRTRGEVPGGQLRGAARHAVRIGNLRLRERRVHRRARPQAGPPRARQRRHAVPRRNRRHVAHRAGQAAARARGAALRAARRPQVDLGRLPADLGDQPAARAVRARRPVPRGSRTTASTRSPSGCRRCASGRWTSRCWRSGSSRATAPRRACRSTARAFSREALDLLVTYHWPGNIRELESTVSRAALSAPGRAIRAVGHRVPARDDADDDAPSGDRLPSLAEAERAHIVRVLEAVRWNKKEAARVLDISRGTLYRKIVEYQLEPETRPRGPQRRP